MGQQQLLLIVLGVIIVGIAVVVGINLFNANAEESAKDTIVSEGVNLGAMAQQYYKKPVALGGGGNTFTGFTIPARLDSTLAGGGGKWVNNVTGTTGGTLILDPADYPWTVTITVNDSLVTAAVN